MPRAARRPEAPTAHKSRIFRYTFLLVTDVLLKVAFQKGFKGGAQSHVSSSTNCVLLQLETPDPFLGGFAFSL